MVLAGVAAAVGVRCCSGRWSKGVGEEGGGEAAGGEGGR